MGEAKAFFEKIVAECRSQSTARLRHGHFSTPSRYLSLYQQHKKVDRKKQKQGRGSCPTTGKSTDGASSKLSKESKKETKPPVRRPLVSKSTLSRLALVSEEEPAARSQSGKSHDQMHQPYRMQRSWTPSKMKATVRQVTPAKALFEWSRGAHRAQVHSQLPFGVPKHRRYADSRREWRAGQVTLQACLSAVVEERRRSVVSLAPIHSLMEARAFPLYGLVVDVVDTEFEVEKDGAVSSVVVAKHSRGIVLHETSSTVGVCMSAAAASAPGTSSSSFLSSLSSGPLRVVSVEKQFETTGSFSDLCHVLSAAAYSQRVSSCVLRQRIAVIVGEVDEEDSPGPLHLLYNRCL